MRSTLMRPGSPPSFQSPPRTFCRVHAEVRLSATCRRRRPAGPASMDPMPRPVSAASGGYRHPSLGLLTPTQFDVQTPITVAQKSPPPTSRDRDTPLNPERDNLGPDPDNAAPLAATRATV